MEHKYGETSVSCSVLQVNMIFDIITIFPKIFSFREPGSASKSFKDSSAYFDYGIIRRALDKKLIDIRVCDLRKYAEKGDAHRSVDDRPYGGGPGMILRIEPIYKSLRALKVFNPKSKKQNRIIMLTPNGKRYTQRDAERLAKYKQVVLLCGRYEGFDARVDKLVDEKISIGDYVLAGGELAGLAIIESVARNLPGVVGHKEALKEETFSKDLEYKEYPQYTRPEIFYADSRSRFFSRAKGQSSAGFASAKKRPSIAKGRPAGINRAQKPSRAWRVPGVLLSGNHKKINEWREKNAR